MANNKTYFLDLRTLLTYLQKASSCTITTQLVVKGKTGMGAITLQSGKVIRAWITFQDGRVLEGPQAFELLQACTQWQVQWDQDTEKRPVSSPLPSQPVNPLLSFPTNNNQPPGLSFPLKQKRDLSAAQRKKLSTQQQRILHSILSRIDGRHSAEDLKAQLNLPPETIDQVLSWLRSLDIIE